VSVECDNPFMLIQVLSTDPRNTELPLPTVHF